MKPITIIAICAIFAATLMGGCIESEPAEPAEHNTLNQTEATEFGVELQRIVNNHIDAIDAARDDRDDSFGVSFDQWDIKTDELFSTSRAKEDDLYVEYMGSSMTHDVYIAKYNAIWNAYDRQRDMYAREYDREYERAQDMYSDVKDELTKEYEDSVTALISEIGGD